MPYTSIGALLALLGVAAGAFGAHALKAHLDPGLLQTFEVAVRYQLVHALALLFVGSHAGTAPRAGARLAGALFIAGVVVFSGSLYALVATGVRAWGAVTPFGGLAFMAGWAATAHAFWPRRSRV
jgi:uncharacterized membrane protein YgdD (TMEM256/DUF423 family)